MAKYDITPEGQVTEEGNGIGWVEAGTEICLKEGVEISPQAMAYLKKLLADETVRDSVRLEEPALQPHAAEIPPEPAMDPRYGDKTPAYAEWLFKFFPDQAAKRYAGRKIMGKHMPVIIDPKAPPELPQVKMQEAGADVPESAMAVEAPEVWL
jgi:hypothetical protein